MVYRASTLGSIASSLLSSGSWGTTISVFHTTVNIRMGGDLLTVTSKMTRSPLNINVKPHDSYVGRGLTRGSRISFDGSQLDMGYAAVEIGDHDIYENDIAKPSRNSFVELSGKEKSLALALLLVQKEGSAASPSFPRRDFVARLLREGGSRTMLMGLVGAGQGYTPSGDDFISGYLAARNDLSEASGLGSIVLPCHEVERITVWVSAELLCYAQRLVVDEVVEGALNSISAGDAYGLMDAISSLAARGHSSGVDTAAGLLVALFEAMDSALGGSRAASLASVLGL